MKIPLKLRLMSLRHNKLLEIAFNLLYHLSFLYCNDSVHSCKLLMISLFLATVYNGAKKEEIMTLGNKLRQLRKENQYTQEALAEILNVSRQTISKWETDVAVPDMVFIKKLSHVYQISIDSLLDHQYEKHPHKGYIIDLLVLVMGFIGFVIFAILLITQRMDETSSVITLNSYGILSAIFFVVVMVFGVIMYKKHVKK